MGKHKIIAVVKFNDHEALVLAKPIKLRYTKYTDCIIGTDGVFINCFYFDRPSDAWQAFAGRKFDIKLSSGEVEHCTGQWWDGINKTADKILGNNEIVRTTAECIDDLRKCYVFCGYRAIKPKYEKLRKSYRGKVYEYWEYSKILKNSKPLNLLGECCKIIGLKSL